MPLPQLASVQAAVSNVQSALHFRLPPCFVADMQVAPPKSCSSQSSPGFWTPLPQPQSAKQLAAVSDESHTLFPHTASPLPPPQAATSSANANAAARDVLWLHMDGDPR